MKKIAAIIIVVSSILLGRTNTFAQVSVQIQVAPPEIPVCVQPACPVDGYMWTPGYWAYGSGGYYWVPGMWVIPAQTGFLWTPGYWGFEGGYYGWNNGYWGQHIGFYGGVCYGGGYGGVGFGGGRWDGGHFRYNTAVCNVNTTVIHNTYVDRTVINNNSNRSSFNGAGGIASRPTIGEQSAMKENHIQATSRQQSHQMSASKNRNKLASVNGGHPMAHAAKSPSSTNNATHANRTTPQAAHANVPLSNPKHQATHSQQAPRAQQHQAASRQQAPIAQQQHRVAPQQQRAPERSAPSGGHEGGGGERR